MTREEELQQFAEQNTKGLYLDRHNLIQMVKQGAEEPVGRVPHPRLRVNTMTGYSFQFTRGGELISLTSSF